MPKSGNNVLFPNQALSMELPGMAKGGNVNVSKSGPFHGVAKNAQNWQCICFPGVARNGNGVCPRMPKSGNKINIILQGKKKIKNRTADYIRPYQVNYLFIIRKSEREGGFFLFYFFIYFLYIFMDFLYFFVVLLLKNE